MAEVVRLGDLISVKHGYAFPGSGFSDDPAYPTLVTPGNFAIGGGFKLSKPKTFMDSYPADFVLHVDDLVVSMTDLSREGATLGCPAMIPTGRRFLHNQRIGLVEIRDTSALDLRFLNYFLRTAEYRKYVLATASGTTVRHTSPSRIEDFRASIPLIAEQRAISSVLGALDDKIAANERAAKTALALADSLFEQARSPSEERTTIGELADRTIIEFGDGYRTKRSEHGKPGLRILRAGDVRDFQLLPTGDDYVSADYSRQIGGKASKPGDVVMTTKGTVGRVAVVGAHTEQVVYSPQICYFRVRDSASLGVGCLAAWFRSPDLTSQTASLMYKSDMAPYINLRDIRSLSMPIFEPSVQHRQSKLQRGLLDRFDACCVENERLARTRDELLPLLMSGKLGVKAAETVASEVL